MPTIILLILLGFAPANTTAPEPVTSSTNSKAFDATRPCKFEDSHSCVWDAKHRGNGKGRSFIANGEGDIKYVSHRIAHRRTH